MKHGICSHPALRLHRGKMLYEIGLKPNHEPVTPVVSLCAGPTAPGYGSAEEATEAPKVGVHCSIATSCI
jgi:hypothetical protein